MRHNVMRLLVLLALLLLLLPGQAWAIQSDGYEIDETLYLVSTAASTNSQCGFANNCHNAPSDDVGASIDLTFNPGSPYQAGESLNVTVNTTGLSQAEPYLGILLLNSNNPPYYGNITDNWTITEDPKGNKPGFGYNYFTNGINQKVTWNLSAPSPEVETIYYLIGQARIGQSSPKARSLTTGVYQVTVQGATPEFPLGVALLISMSGLIYLVLRGGVENSPKN